MFIKRCLAKFKDKEYETFWIVESYRDNNNKIKHKYLLDVTRFTPKQRENLKKVLKNPDALVYEDLNEIFDSAYSYGDVVFLLLIFKKLGLIKILNKHLDKKSLSLILAVILNRIINPTSKLESVNWIKNTAYPLFTEINLEDLHVNRIYEAMDKLNENLNSIMEDFYMLGGETPKFLLYDITSTYFEGSSVRKAKYGYSRDEKDNNPQVILGLVLNEKGFPIHFEIFDGNTQDRETVQSVLQRIKDRFGIERATFIGDRGMISIHNIEKIKSLGFNYILAMKHSSARELLKKNNIQPELFDSELPITILEEDDKKYVLCGSIYRRERDLKSFNIILDKGRKTLNEVKEMVRSGVIKDSAKILRRAERKLSRTKASSYFDFAYINGEFSFWEKEELIEKSRALCGYYILETTEKDLPDIEVENRYKNLQEVERAWRDLKDIVKIRPIFHFKDRRVETHIYLCLIAQAVIGYIRRKLKEKSWLSKVKENTLEYFFEELNSISIGKFNINNKEVFAVQRENPLKDLLLLAFNIKPFDYKRDKKLCSI
ncbi:MAG TPA: IS1634 family transposase [Caldisericia bacterium]|nr:IS1634 family transposase [Caldisericia bacterium]HXK69953.1 IS1634 family transposase [Caldisericia bacterium]